MDFKLLALLLTFFAIVWGINADAHIVAVGEMQAVQLSDSALTGNNSSADIHQVTIATETQAHIIWSERYGDDLSALQKDLLYAPLPDGEAINLSRLVGGLDGDVTSATMEAGLDDSVHVVWTEKLDDGVESHLFYWRTGMTTPLRLSEQYWDTLFACNAGIHLVVIDNIAHIFWSETEAIDVDGSRVFMWHEGGGIELLSGDYVFPPSHSVFCGALTQAVYVEDGQWHVVWRENSAEHVYWDGTNSIELPLFDNNVTLDDSSLGRGHIDSAGVFHQFWMAHELSTNTGYWQYWNTTLPQSLLIYQGDISSLLFNTDSFLESDDIVYFILQLADASLHYWDSSNQQVNLLDIDTASWRVTQAGHVSWHRMEDLFYWNPAQPTLNVSEARNSYPDQVEVYTDEADESHMIWLEDNEWLHFDSASLATTAISCLNPNGMFATVTDYHSLNDKFYWLFPAAPATGLAFEYFSWERSSGMCQNIDVTQATPLDNAAFGLTLWFDSAGMEQLAWIEPQDNAALGNVYHWQPNGSDQNYTLLDPSGEATDSRLSAVADDQGGIYLFWREGFGPSLQFGGFGRNHGIQLFLPIIENGS